MASPELKVIIDLIKSRPPLDGLSVEDQRQGVEERSGLLPLPAGVSCKPTSAGGVPAEWVTATEASQDAVVLYLHGGGYVICSLNTHRDLVARIALASGARVLNLDYRLAPEHPFPAAVEDATAAYRWLLAQNVDPARIVIAGDSAGGGLTIAALVALRDVGDPLPAAAVCISPWTDLALTGESLISKADVDPMVTESGARGWAAHYLAEADPRDPLASPLYADLSGLPPLLILVGTAEVLLDDATRLAGRAEAAGVDTTLEVWDDMIHIWPVLAAMLPEGQAAVERIGEFIKEQIGAPVAPTAAG
jgi:acetyl esterase/lipase